MAASGVYYRSLYNCTVLHGDEGIVLEGAQRILSGQVLYRDFFSFVTPASYYWMALLFKIFGSSILVARTVLVLYGGFFSVFLYFLARRACSRWTAIFTVYLFTLTCLPYEFRALHNWDSTFWACLGIYLTVRHLERPHWGWALGVGACASLTCLFEQSKGAGLVLGLAVGLGLAYWRGSRDRIFSWGYLRALLLGFAVPALIAFAYFASHHALAPMLEDCLWPLRHYASVNSLPYGYPELVHDELEAARELSWGMQVGMLAILSPFFILPALPLVAAGLLAFWVLRLARRTGPAPAEHFLVIGATLAALLLTVVASGRPDLSHLIIFNGPLFYLVLAWAIEKSFYPSPFLDGVRTMASLFLFFSFTALGLAILWRPLNSHALLQTRRGTLKAERPDAVLDEIQARVMPGEKIFVYPYQPLYYYLTATVNPTRFEYLQLGMHTPEQFEEVTRELAASRVPVVIFQPSFPEFIPHAWPATPLNVLGGKDGPTEYILRHYRACRTMTSVQKWQLVFMVRNDLSCQAPL